MSRFESSFGPKNENGEAETGRELAERWWREGEAERFAGLAIECPGPTEADCAGLHRFVGLPELATLLDAGRIDGKRLGKPIQKDSTVESGAVSGETLFAFSWQPGRRLCPSDYRWGYVRLLLDPSGLPVEGQGTAVYRSYSLWEGGGEEHFGESYLSSYGLQDLRGVSGCRLPVDNYLKDLVDNISMDEVRGLPDGIRLDKEHDFRELQYVNLGRLSYAGFREWLERANGADYVEEVITEVFKQEGADALPYTQEPERYLRALYLVMTRLAQGGSREEDEAYRVR